MVGWLASEPWAAAGVRGNGRAKIHNDAAAGTWVESTEEQLRFPSCRSTMHVRLCSASLGAAPCCLGKGTAVAMHRQQAVLAARALPLPTLPGLSSCRKQLLALENPQPDPPSASCQWRTLPALPPLQR